MVAAELGADTLLTDLEGPLKLLRHNVEENRKNFPKWRAEVREFVWSKETAEALLNEKTRIDYVLMADCIYYKESINPLLETLKVFAQPGTTIFLVQELRESKVQIDLFKEFLKTAREFLIIKEVPMRDQHPHYKSDEIMVFSCRKK